jgi:hypothetical protein
MNAAPRRWTVTLHHDDGIVRIHSTTAPSKAAAVRNVLALEEVEESAVINVKKEAK